MYKFDKNIIHDDKAMWNLALSFYTRYNFLKEQIERSEGKERRSILFKGKIIMKWDDNYKKILTDYKKEFGFMNNMISFDLECNNNKLDKYIEK